MDTVSTYHIAPNEAAGNDFVSAEHSLKAASSAAGRSRLLKSIWFSSPYLDNASKRLARMISHHYPDPNGEGSLLLNALNDAAIAFAQSSETAPRQEHHEQAFLDALIKRSTHLVDLQVFGLWDDGSSEAWPTLTMPLIDWVKKRHVPRVCFVPPINDVDASQRRAGRILLATHLVQFDRAEDLCRMIEEDGAQDAG